MNFPYEFCQKLETYVSICLESEVIRPRGDGDAARLIKRKVSDRLEKAGEDLWEFLKTHGFSDDEKDKLPDLTPLGIAEANSLDFLVILNWLFEARNGMPVSKTLFQSAYHKQLPTNVRVEDVRLLSIDGDPVDHPPFDAIEQLAASVGYKTELMRSLAASLDQLKDQSQPTEATPPTPATQELRYIFDLHFDEGDKAISRDGFERVEQIQPIPFEVIFTIAEYIRIHGCSRCPTPKLFEAVWKQPLKNGLAGVSQRARLYQAVKAVNKAVWEKLKVRAEGSHSHGYTITEETPKAKARKTKRKMA